MEKTIEKVQAETMSEFPKPYKFRRLEAADVFIMFKIISAIGVNEFKVLFEAKGLVDLVTKLASAKGKKAKTDEEFIAVGASVFLDLVQVIITNIPKCEREIYQLLSQVSNMKAEHIKELDAVTFTEMVIDFLKKEEFGDFFKVVSKLFK